MAADAPRTPDCTASWPRWVEYDPLEGMRALLHDLQELGTGLDAYEQRAASDAPPAMPEESPHDGAH